MDTLAAANGMPVVPVMVVLLAITAVGLLVAATRPR
jgi:hypothetical protein